MSVIPSLLMEAAGVENSKFGLLVRDGDAKVEPCGFNGVGAALAVGVLRESFDWAMAEICVAADDARSIFSVRWTART